ncbi:hypothetical protein L596_008667 [Steinernema carpocapsae]|uniref:Uncharacterized protein n=1 Tax=Steinernema carpocapsae TaxID=34508 RepID=A0A4U5PDC2_STECR|nr:hypothetical protein L596_008667 [Steinernema carpocapsae]
MLCHVRCSDVTLFAFVFIGLSLSLAQPLAQQNDLPYKVYRIYPQNWKDVDQIAQIRKMEIEKQLDFWVDSNSPNQFADLMVPPFMIEEIEEFFERHKLRFNVTIPDVQKLIYRNEIQRQRRLLVWYMIDDNRIGHTRADYPFGDYASYKAMMKFMRTIEFYYPKFTKLIRIGMTHEGRPIEGLKIGFPIENTSKRAVWIDGNIHAREWASSHTALFFINQLVAGYGNDREVTDYIDNLNFFIIPNLNPDGYEYTRESSRPEYYTAVLWNTSDAVTTLLKLNHLLSSEARLVKVRDSSVEEEPFTGKMRPIAVGGLRCCQGVDLNRNFAWHWSETGSTENPCSNLYHGSGVFSEPEARAVNDFLTTPQMADKVDAFITLHTYAQLWIHPFSHELGSYTRDYHDLRNLGVKAAKRLESVYGTHYKVGTGADLLSPASGGSDDWAKGTLGIKYVYTLELRPELEVSRGFILHKSELIPTGVETFEAVKEVVKAVLKYNNIDVDRSKQRETQRPLEEAPRPPNFVQGVSNVISQAKSTELEPTPVVNKVVFGNVKNREILIFSKNSQPSVFTEVPVVVSSFSTSTTTTTTSMSTLATTSTTTTTTAATPKPTTPSTTTSTTTTSTASPSTTTTTTTVPATVTTTPSTTALTTTTTTQAPTTTTTVATTTTIEARVLKPYRPVVQNNMATSHERQKLSYGQRLSLQLIRKQMLRLRNQTPTTSSYPRTPPPSSTLPPSTEPPIAMAPLRADMSLEEQATVPKLEPAVVFLAERGPVAQSTMHRSAPRFLTVSLQRPPANREILLLPPLRSDAPMTGINEIVGKPETVFSPKPMSPSVQEFLTGESCKDIRYSCAYWIRNNPRVCVEQDTYMRLQCAATCGYCNQ